MRGRLLFSILLTLGLSTATAALEGVVYYDYAGMLHRMDADGSNVELVDELFGYDDMGISPAVTPDGAVLVFASSALGGWSIFRYDFDAESSLIYDSGDWDGLPALDPAGERLSCASMGDGSGAEIILLELDDPSSAERLTEMDAWARWPVWSPDGGAIYYVHGDPGEDRSELLRLDPVDGSISTVKTFHGEVKEIDISPDGALFALTYRPAGADSFGIHLYDPTADELTPLTAAAVDCVAPCFTGDGRCLYYNTEVPVEYPDEHYYDDPYDPDYRSNPEKSLPGDGEETAETETESTPESGDIAVDEPAWLTGYRNTIHLVDLETGEDHPLTPGENACWCDPAGATP